MNPTIDYYRNFIPAPLLRSLWDAAEPVNGVDGLRVGQGLQESFDGVETPEALRFVCELYEDVAEDLQRILEQRNVDRAFVDRKTQSYVAHNRELDFHSSDYRTVIGDQDSSGRVVVGPVRDGVRPKRVDIPGFIDGEHVTLFGPPDTAKLSINAMNAIHRVPHNEPPIVGDLVESSGEVARWGADNEDSKTPIMRNFLHACENLMGCFDGTLRFVDDARNREYELADHRLSIPIKRIPGLAIPDGNHLFHREPLPLHLVDFGLHLFHNRRHDEAFVFYVPKLENEEEATYVKTLIESADRLLSDRFEDYVPGRVKLFVVFENPRAIFRISEIVAALEPYFLGGSLGWHDFLASTARLFRYDPRYRIPVKADPNIVINHIRESHSILVDALEPLGAVKIGGMYGVLYEDGNPASYEVSMVGYIRDVVTQLKRGLDGFWVAHPDFVRPGIALVEAYRRWENDADRESLTTLITALVPGVAERESLIEFVFGVDVQGLDESDPNYPRAVLAATLETSDVIANHDPEEVRYNVFQALQYLADWLCGNGCVALPAQMTNSAGDDVFVRIMDDLATTERSRWEVWAEIAHGRVSVELFESILEEELEFIQRGVDANNKRIQVRWEDEASRWYPVAEQILRQLVRSESPPEFATELLLPFTFDLVRNSENPWKQAVKLCPGKFEQF